MDVSRVARTVLLGTVTAVVVALAGFAWCPTATATPAFDETGLMKAGSAAEFDVLANDPAGTDWYAEPVDTSDSAVSGVGPTISVYLYDAPGFTGAKTIAYNVFDGDGALQHTSTLTVQVVPASLTAEGGDGQVTLKWAGLPGAVDGARISYGTGSVFDHGVAEGKTTVVATGAAPWTITGLTNDTQYRFYVTPRMGAAEMQDGSAVPSSPRAGTNVLPVAIDDTVSLVDDDARSFDPAQNDTDVDDDPLEMVGHTDPAHGVLTCDSFGCGYEPTGARQDDSFSYTVADGYGGTDTGTVTLTARHITLNSDTASTPATKDEVVDVLANDTGVLAGDQVYVNTVSGGASADVQPDRTVLFRAPSAGTYTFTYDVFTADFESLGTATATITVGPAPPIAANADADDTSMGVPVTISVGRNDVINQANFPLNNVDTKVVAAPDHGTAVVDFEPERYGSPQRLRNLPMITYSPTRHWKGTDTFTYQIKDRAGNVDSTTVTVTVGTPGPDFVYTDDGIGETTVNWFGNDSPDIDQIEVCYATGSELGTPPAYPTRPCAKKWPVTGTPDSQKVTGLTNGNVYSGSVYFHYDDGSAGGIWTGASRFKAHPGVGPVDTLWSEAGTTTPPDRPRRIRVFWRNPGSSVGTTVAWSTTGSPRTPAAAGANRVDLPQGVTHVDLTGLRQGTAYYVTVFARNPGGGYSTGEELNEVLLRASNSAPTAVTDAVDVNRNQTVSFNPRNNDTDPDTGDATGIRGNTDPAHGTASCGLFSCSYTPTPGYVGNDSFTYTLSDGHWGTATGTVNLTVGAPRNPVGRTDSYTSTIDKALSFDLDDTSFDANGGTLTYGSFSALAGLSCGSNGACTYTGTALGDVQFTFTVTDDTARTDTGTILIKVVSNKLPSVGNRSVTVQTGGTVPIALSATDPDGDALTFGDHSKPQKGTLTCSTPRTCSYQQDLVGESGEDSFFYSVDDGHGTLVWGEVYIAIKKVNHAPVASGFTAASTDNRTPAAIDLTAHATDSDRDPLTYVVVADPAATQGSVTCSAAGSCAFTPSSSFTGNATFTFRANDGRRVSSPATVTIPVTRANRAPVTPNQAFTVRQGDPRAVTLSTGVSDPDGDTVRYGAPTNPPHGTVTCTSATACSYTSDAAYLGTDSFTYTVTDSRPGHVKTVRVTMTVMANRAPVATHDTASVVMDVATPVDVAANDAADPDGDPRTFAKASEPAHGTVTCTGAGLCTYRPATGYVGPDAFTYTVDDAHGGTDTGGVAVTVVSGSGTTTGPEVTAGLHAVSMPSHKATGDKYVTITNIGKTSVNLKGWILTTRATKTLTLPSFSLAAAESVRIHPGSGRTQGADVYLRKGTSLFARHESLTLRDLLKVTVATRKW